MIWPLVGAGLSYMASRNAAQREMEFSERMSSTAWSRAVMDMRSAGLNPMLAFSQGPASSPTASIENPAEGLPEAISSSVALRQQERMNRAQREMMGAQQDMYAAQAGAASAQGAKAWAEANQVMANYNWEQSFRGQKPFMDDKGVLQPGYWAEEYAGRVNRFREAGFSLQEAQASVELLNLSKDPARWDAMKASQLLKMFQGSDARQKLAILLSVLNQHAGTASNLLQSLMLRKIPKWR